jgi:hypothetical protein
MTSIYLLLDPRDHKLNWIRYVGKTNNIKRRKWEHNNENNQLPKNRWIKKLKKANLKPIMKRIAIVPESQWQECEMELIAYYRSITGEGVELLNVSDGGDGGSNKGRKFPKDFGRKISNALKGRQLSQEHSENISRSLTGKKKSPEHCKKISVTHSGKTVSKKTREAISKHQTGRVLPIELKRKISQSAKGNSISKEARMKISKISKGGNKKARPVLQYTLDVTFVKEHPSGLSVEKNFGISAKNACYIDKATAFGYQWRFKDEINKKPITSLP